MATLIGYGASAINPYVMLETVDELLADGRLQKATTSEEAQKNIVKAIGKGLLKTISKMGISTIQSYNGAQIFEAVGLEHDLVDRHFTGTASRIGGIGLDVLAQETLDRHARAYPRAHGDLLPVGGVYAWRRDGEFHQWNPETISLIQHAVRQPDGTDVAQAKYDEYAEMINTDASRRATLRGLMTFSTDVEPIPLEAVEPAKEIVKRFATGAMSLGSISTVAHENLAIAMNRLGKSNTGEGGEDPRRFHPEANGDSSARRSSGRLRPLRRDRHYLVNADQIQIKMAQGASPSEAASCPVTRSTSTSARSGTRRRAWGSSPRRRTTTSTPSRISSSSSTTGAAPTPRRRSR